MKLRRVGELVAACAAMASGAARAQESVTYALAWSEVLANSNQPVALPNGKIEPGEGVRIAIRATITPGIGSTATYTPPPPPGVGTIAGFGQMAINLYGTNLNGGTWSGITRNAETNPGGVPGGGNWTLGAPGTGEVNGDITALQAGQFLLPGNIANSTNPIENIWRGTWTPADYTSPRVASIRTAPAVAGPPHSSILIQYGIDANGDPQYVGKFVGGTFGNTGPIPIVPGPGVVVLLAAAVGGLTLARQRR